MKFGPHTIAQKGTLYQAATLAVAKHWRGTRWGNVVQNYLWPLVSWLQEEKGVRDLEDITREMINDFVDLCEHKGNSQQTINHKLGALKTVFSVARDNKLTKHEVPHFVHSRRNQHIAAGASKKPGWWLSPELIPYVTKALIDQGARPLALYILWACHTGLRVEESLRLHFSHFNRSTRLLTVPGSKTKASMAPIVLSEAAIAIYDAIREDTEGERMFPTNTVTLRANWNNRFVPLVKDTLSPGQKPQLRDLRATFATMMNLKGMPLDLIRGLLRHSKVSTTLGYLRKTGELGKEQALAYLDSSTREEAEVRIRKFADGLGWKIGEMKQAIARKTHSK